MPSVASVTFSAGAGAVSAAATPSVGGATGASSSRNPPARATPDVRSVAASTVESLAPDSIRASDSTARVCSTHVRDPAPDSIGRLGWSVSTAAAPNAITRTVGVQPTPMNGATSNPAATVADANACSSPPSGLPMKASRRRSSRSGR